MMSVSCYQTSASLTNLWLFNFLSHIFFVVPLHCHFLHAINEIYNFTNLPFDV